MRLGRMFPTVLIPNLAGYAFLFLAFLGEVVVAEGSS